MQMTMETAAVWYMVLGAALCLLCIAAYRRDGQTERKGEMYLAVLGVFLWPLALVLVIRDLMRRRAENRARD